VLYVLILCHDQKHSLTLTMAGPNMLAHLNSGIAVARNFSPHLDHRQVRMQWAGVFNANTRRNSYVPSR
jgi:hypothetical protein